MTIHFFWKSALLIAAIVVLASGCGEETKGTPDGGGDTNDDSETECECASIADNYCDGETAMQCLDGCHFTPDYCAESNDDDGWGWCASGECFFDPFDTDPNPDCTGPEDNYCDYPTILMECQISQGGENNYYEEVDCTDSALCQGVGGCAVNDDGIAACWCDAGDGGVGDAGVDGGE